MLKDTLTDECSDWDKLTRSEKDKVNGWKKLKNLDIQKNGAF